MSESIVFIVDDDASVRDGVNVLCECAGLKTECHDSAESFLAAYRPNQRGCLLLDVRMGAMSGPELHAQLNQMGSPLAVIYVSGNGNIPMSVRAIKAGAENFMTKPVEGAELLNNIRLALKESERIAREVATKRKAAEFVARLTKREHDVMTLLIQGLPHKEIACRLGISHRTVEIHKARIMEKTHSSTIIDLTMVASAAGDLPY